MSIKKILIGVGVGVVAFLIILGSVKITKSALGADITTRRSTKVATFTIGTSLLPDSDLGADIGASALRFNVGYFGEILANNSTSSFRAIVVSSSAENAFDVRNGTGGSTFAVNTVNDSFTFGGGLSDAALTVNYSVDDAVVFAPNAVSDQANHNIVFTNWTNRFSDHDHATFSTDPTIFLHSGFNVNTDNTQYLSLMHNRSDSVITSGKGSVFIQGGVKNSITLIDSATYDVLETDYHICNDYSLTGASSTTLPAVSVIGVGRVLVISDCGGNASANNIAILANGEETIDRVNSSTPYLITTDSGSISLHAVSSTGWKIF